MCWDGRGGEGRVGKGLGSLEVGMETFRPLDRSGGIW